MTAWLWVLVSFFSLILFQGASAELLQKPRDILEQHFGASSTFQKRNLLLSRAEAKALSEKLGTKVKDRLFVFFEARDQNKELLGFAGVLTRKVRTKDQTALYLLNRKGEIDVIELVAFYEPPEYLPSRKWLTQFKGREPDENLRREIRAVSGATLTASSFVASAQLIQSIWALKLKGG